MSEFSKRTILITGAQSGIGLATAKEFAQSGANLFLVDLNAEKLNAICKEIGNNAKSFVADISDYNQCQAMVFECEKQFGDLYVAFNNAGVPTPMGQDFEALSLDEWNRVISINLGGVFNSLKAELPLLKKSGGKAVINTASVTSFIAGRGMAAYVASKHGVAGLTKAASVDFIKHGIRVNAICPGITATGMTADIIDDPHFVAHVKEVAPIGRVASAHEIAKAVVFLASEASSYCVGALLRADGGMSII